MDNVIARKYEVEFFEYFYNPCLDKNGKIISTHIVQHNIDKTKYIRYNNTCIIDEQDIPNILNYGNGVKSITFIGFWQKGVGNDDI